MLYHQLRSADATGFAPNRAADDIVGQKHRNK
jgi:hypothetical protein